MLTVSAVVGFALALLPLVMTPGASFTLVSSRGLSGDRRGAWHTIVGTGLGILTHACLAGAGLAVVVMRSAQLYQAIRLAGALYLIGLGVVLIWRQQRRACAEDPHVGQAAETTAGGGQLWRAYVANVLNVKAASVYLSLAPQFIAESVVGVQSMLLLGCVHVVVMGAWLGLWAMGLTALTRRVDPRRWVRRVNVAGGAVLVALGLRSAAQAR